jgi:23S rRNA pseudouridine2457 synthase
LGKSGAISERRESGSPRSDTTFPGYNRQSRVVCIETEILDRLPRDLKLTHRTIALYKPYDVVCQFSDSTGRSTLKNFVPIEGIYPVGRLDRDSEGLLILTDDGPLAHRLTDPRFAHPKTYLVQVERTPERGALDSLRKGVNLRDGWTRPAEVDLLAAPPALADRSVPIRFRKNVPTAWLRLTIHEGRNRQVRRMTAAVGHPTLRLVRIAVGPIALGDLAPGLWRELTAQEKADLERLRDDQARPDRRRGRG